MADWAFTKAAEVWGDVVDGLGIEPPEMKAKFRFGTTIIATALREAHEAGRREGIGEAVGIVDASADELRNAADQWDVRCVGQDAERIGADYRAREQHDRFLATAIRALAEEGRE